MTVPASRARTIIKRTLLALLILLLPPAFATGYALAKLRSTIFKSVPAPEAPTGLRAVNASAFKRAVVVAAHPEAARLGAEVLTAGGSAIDAAVAVQAALALVEPQSSGIGGGAFLLYYDAPSGRLVAFDGRETAPAAATPARFLNAKGKPMSFPQAMLGGLSVGVPGVVRMLALAHGQFGKKSWSELFAGPAALAENGFAVTPRLNLLVGADPVLPAVDPLRSYFLRSDGWPHEVGARLVNKPLAQTLRAIGSGGPDAFYRGQIAQDLVAAVHAAHRPTLPRAAFNLVARTLGVAATGSATVAAEGDLTPQDLADYRALQRDPICVPYRKYRVCSLPPPSGGVSVLQVLKLLEAFKLSEIPSGSVDEMHALLEAEALAEADRDQWVADPAFAKVPTEGLLSASYLAERGRGIANDRSMTGVAAGHPPGSTAQAVPGQSFEVPSTSHFVIVDAQGSVASMTTSIEFGFGSHVMVDGFLLNNQLTDFAFTPQKDGHKVFNSVEAGKRPRSAMAPIIVFDGQTNRPLLALGSPGGPRITGYIAQTLIGVLDHGLSPNEAIARPHVVYAKGTAEVEDVGWSTQAARSELVNGLRARGHEVSVQAENSGLHGVAISSDGLVPGIDPRREGVALGP